MTTNDGGGGRGGGGGGDGGGDGGGGGDGTHIARERAKKKGLLLGIKSPFKFGMGKKKEVVNGDGGGGVVVVANNNSTNNNNNNNNSDSAVVAAKQSVEVVDRLKVNGTTGKAASGGAAADTKRQDRCAGCGDPLGDGHALMALDRQYHIWCFKCAECGAVLQGEYMGKDGKPYCERDYQGKFGVKCTYCGRFISGKVLQAGNNNHFHPTCARCTKCGNPFGDGEEMFLQGAAIWHPRCGPGPDEATPGGELPPGLGFADNDDGTSVVSGPFFPSRASSPGASLRRGDGQYGSGRFSRSTTHVPGWNTPAHHGGGRDHRHYYGMYTASSCYSLRRPLEPGDRMDSLASVNHFHLPPSRRSASTYVSRYAPTPTPTPAASAAAAAASASSAAATPRPGYSCDRRSRSAVSPGPGMHYGDYDEGGGGGGGGGGGDSASRSYRYGHKQF